MHHLCPSSSLLVLLTGLAAGCSAQPPAAAPSRAPGPAAALSRPSGVVDAVAQLSSRSPAGRQVIEGPVAGTRVVRITDGHAEVVIARTNPDGTVSTRCVDSAGSAQQFLEGDSTAAAPRADR